MYLENMTELQCRQPFQSISISKDATQLSGTLLIKFKGHKIFKLDKLGHSTISY